MSSISRRQFLRVSGVAAAGAVLTACQPAAKTEAPAENKPAEQPTQAEAAKPAGPTRPTTWPIGDIPRNRTLIYHNNTPAAGNFNPFAAGYTHQNGNAILHEPAAFYSALGDKTYMWLAESYKYNDDATECDITFRKGIKWSDGTPFTAKDIAFAMTKMKTVKGLARGGTYFNELDTAEAVDDTNLKVKLKQTDWRLFFKSLTFRFDLGDEGLFVMPEHVWKDVPDEEIPTFKNYDQAKKWPVTTGPYGISDATDQYTYYDLWPTWWAVETGFVKEYPAAWRIRQEAFTNDTLAAQKLINKEIDHPLDLRPMVVASLLVQADHLSTWTGRKPPFGYMDWWPISIQFCTAKPPFDNPKVRWAIAYAIDQQKVVDVGWAGAGLVANAPFPGYPKLVGYMDGIKDIVDKYNVLEFNLEKSAALMTEAGFTKNKDGFWADKDGVVPDSNLFAGVPLFGDIAPVVAEQLRAAGFACEHKAPPDVWAAKTDGRASMFLFGHGGATIDPYDTFMLYHSEPLPMGEQDWSNITRWHNQDFIAVTDEMNKTAMDDPKMKDLFKKGMEIWYQELPDLPLVQWFHRIPVNNWYFENWPTAENPYMNSALWHLTMLQVVLGLKATDKA